MMSENGYTLSLDMQKAVKTYLLNNSEKYQKAMKKTGPIDNTSLYRAVQGKRDQSVVTHIFAQDDPYWQNFLRQNSKRTQ